jgi:hypothetical protein
MDSYAVKRFDTGQSARLSFKKSYENELATHIGVASSCASLTDQTGVPEKGQLGPTKDLAFNEFDDVLLPNGFLSILQTQILI